MPEFRVTWLIDIDAEDAVTAARQARRYQLDPNAIVGVFELTDKDGHTVKVDLDELDERGDLRFVNHGSIVLLHVLSEAGRSWADEHLSSDALMYGEAFAIEPRYTQPIVDGARRDGLRVVLS